MIRTASESIDEADNQLHFCLTVSHLPLLFGSSPSNESRSVCFLSARDFDRGSIWELWGCERERERERKRERERERERRGAIVSSRLSAKAQRNDDQIEPLF
jgi:hypothetical protein